MPTPEVTQTPEVVQEKVEQVVAQPEVKQDEVREDPNWKVVRELRKKEKAEREAAEQRASEEKARADAMAKALEVALSKSTFNQSSPQQNYAAYPEEETEDQRLEKKLSAMMEKREAQWQRDRAEKEMQQLPSIMQQTYSDYFQVINEDNAAYLKYHDPDLYESIVHLPNTVDGCSKAYRLVKKHVPNATSAKRDEAKAEINFNKPKSMSSTSVTQGGEAGSSARLTEEKRAQNWERMQKQLKGLS